MNRTAIVVPVRMAIGTRVLQSTSRALDIGGLFVRCVSPPLLGTNVAIRLYLPDGPPEDIDCVVVPEHELREVGCRVKFVQLSEPQHTRLARLIAPPVLSPQAKPVSQPPRPFAPGPQAPMRTPVARIELRALVRVPAKILVRFQSVDEMTERLSVDISAGGMFVRAENPPLVGDEVQLLFSLPGEEAAPLACRAVVVRRIAQEEARFTARIAGAGVQFVDADDAFRARLDEWLANAQGLTPLEEEES